MNGNGSGNAAFLHNLQEKLDFLEEKAAHARELMEQAASLSLIKLSEQEVGNPTSENQSMDASADQTEPEVFQQKQQLLQALIGCISDLESLDVSFNQIGAQQNANKEAEYHLSQQHSAVQAFKEQNEAINLQNAAFAQKMNTTQEVFSQLNAEKATFEQTLLELGKMLHAKATKKDDVPSENVVPLMSKEEEKTENVGLEQSTAVDALGDAKSMSELQRQIEELQTVIQQLEQTDIAQ